MRLIAIKKGFTGEKIILENEIFESDYIPSWAVPLDSDENKNKKTTKTRKTKK